MAVSRLKDADDHTLYFRIGIAVLLLLYLFATAKPNADLIVSLIAGLLVPAGTLFNRVVDGVARLCSP